MRYAISLVMGPLVMGPLLLAGVPAQAKPGPRIDAEAKLAETLAGRVAGEPVDCLNLRDIRSSQIINRTAIVYETIGGVVYVNRPDSGASSLTDWDVMVTDTHSSQLCSIDVVHLYDSGLRMQRGVVFLGDFVPYRRVKSGRGW